jgi:hypothetical protein
MTEVASDNRAKRHHFVPRFYLDRFRDPATPSGPQARIWVYKYNATRAENEKPKDMAWEMHFNSLWKSDGDFDTTVEDHLQKIESNAARIWPLLTNQDGLLHDRDRRRITEYMAYQITRTREPRNSMNRWFTKLSRMSLLILANCFDELSVDQRYGFLSADEMREAATSEIHSELPHNALVRNVVSPVTLVANTLYEMRWTVLYTPAKASPDCFFITCDEPVVRESPGDHSEWGQRALSNVNCEVLLPIDPSTVLLLTRHGFDGRATLHPWAVEEMNRRTLRAANNEVYSPFEADWLVDAILDTKLSEK